MYIVANLPDGIDRFDGQKNRESRQMPEKSLVMLSVWTAAVNFVASYLPMLRNQFWPVVIWTYLHQCGRTCIIHSAGSIKNK